MSSSGLNAGTPKAAELFEDVWKHLGELHQNAVQGRNMISAQTSSAKQKIRPRLMCLPILKSMLLFLDLEAKVSRLKKERCL